MDIRMDNRIGDTKYRIFKRLEGEPFKV